MTVDELQRSMNTAGARCLPFLFAVDFELTEGIFVENPALQSDILFRIPGCSNIPAANPADTGTRFRAHPESYENYLGRFRTVMSGLMRGDSFLTNLTVRTPLSGVSSLRQIAAHSNTPFCLCVPERFVCFSPERFVRIAGGRISTNPMKGTIGAGVPDAANTILADPKETAEHYTIVDLMRNDLGMAADDIRVERFRYIDTLETNRGKILQVSSEITGRLPDDWNSHVGDILLRLLPAGSVSGAPKHSTLELIRRAEGIPRGFYTGVFGCFDGRELDSAVMIRFVEEVNGVRYFRSGGGITVNSDPRSEYEEILEKIYMPFV